MAAAKNEKHKDQNIPDQEDDMRGKEIIIEKNREKPKNKKEKKGGKGKRKKDGGDSAD